MAANSIDLGSYPGKDSASFTPGKTDMVLQFTSGAGGAVPATLTKRNGYGKGAAINAVERTGTGAYTAKVARRWAEFAGGWGNVLVAGAYGADVAHDVKILAVDLAAKTVTFVTCQPGTGAVADPGSGDIVILTLRFNRYTSNVAK